MRRLNLHNIICIQSVFNNIQSFQLVFIIHIFSALLVNKIFYGLCFLTKIFFGVKMINSVSLFLPCKVKAKKAEDLARLSRGCNHLYQLIQSS